MLDESTVSVLKHNEVGKGTVYYRVQGYEWIGYG